MMDECAASVILKPLNDKREYKRIILSNGLKVLLVSDPDTDKAAAAMDVHVGSFSNPEGIEGLAHFLEHMLFYANEKYPKEGTYKKFFSEHGGYTNAYTAAEHTNYHFDVNANHLDEALDRFAQFFICPLLSPEATSREIHAVDSENSKNLSSDGWRLGQLQKHLSSKDHPYHKYATGNKDTLHTIPTARGIDIREELLKFYNTYYSAGVMCLAVYGKEPILQLQELVRDKFSAIRNNNVEAPRFLGPPCHSEHLQIVVKSTPLRDQNLLGLYWPVSPSMRNYKKGASTYVQHFLEHEAEGSLFALLKKLGWANSLSSNEDGNLDYSFFSLFLELTNSGQEHVQEILDFTFQYIRLLQHDGVVKWFFEEKRAMMATWFNFRDKSDPFDYVVNLSDVMHTYPPEDWLATNALVSDFDAEVISAFAHELQPQHVRIFCSSKKFEKETTDVEPWYGTLYSVEKIGDMLVKKWENATIDARLHLPSQNVFLPSDFKLISPETGLEHPIIVRKTDISKLWYKHDTKFKTPKAYVYLSFNCPEANYSPEATLLTYIFTRLFADEMNEYACYASLAGLHYCITCSKDGFEVVVEGFHHKLMSLVEMIVEKIVGFEIKEDRFDFVKELVVRNYVNMRFMQPQAQANYNINHLLQHTSWHLTECLDVLPSLDARALTVFFPRLLSRVFIEAFIGGNVTSREAGSMMENIEGILKSGPLVDVKAPCFSQLSERRITCLEPGIEWFYPVAGMNPDDENSAIGIYFQVGVDDSNSNVLLELFTLTAKEQFFNQLRTVEQLGYYVELSEKYHENIRGVQVMIQSTIKDPTQLDQRVEAFFIMYERELRDMTEYEFQNHVRILTDMKREKHKNLWEESDFYWGEISGGSLQFDRVDTEVDVLQRLKKEDLQEFFFQKIKLNGLHRKKLSVQVFGNQHNQELLEAKTEVPLTKAPHDHANGTSNGSHHSTYKPPQPKLNAHANGHENGLANGYIENGPEHGLANGHDENGLANGHVEDGLVNGHANGLANEIENGHEDGHVNGITNGHKNGHVNGITNYHENGHANGIANYHENEHANGIANDHENGHANGIANGRENGHANGTANGRENGHANGTANGRENGHANGTANGHENGHANGIANDHENGHANGIANDHENGHANWTANGHENGHVNGLANGLANGHENGHVSGLENGHDNGHANEHANGNINDHLSSCYDNGVTKAKQNGVHHVGATEVDQIDLTYTENGCEDHHPRSKGAPDDANGVHSTLNDNPVSRKPPRRIDNAHTFRRSQNSYVSPRIDL